VRLIDGESVVNLASFHRGHKYVHTDIVKAKFCGIDDNDDGQWEILDFDAGGSYYGESLSSSIEQHVRLDCGAVELRRWVIALANLENPIWLSDAQFCPIYRFVDSDNYKICCRRTQSLIDCLNRETQEGWSYRPGRLKFEFRPRQRKETGKPHPYGFDGQELIDFLHRYLSEGGKLQIVSKSDLQTLIGVDDKTIAAFIDNGAVPLAASGDTVFDCMQLAKFLAHAYTKCWDGWKFVWGHQWKIERGSKPNALRIGDEDWYEVNYEARGPGIYLLFKDSKLQYVGESGCVMQRVATHYKHPQWGDFDLALYRPVEAKNRRAIERHYTRELCPQFDPHRYQVCN